VQDKFQLQFHQAWLSFSPFTWSWLEKDTMPFAFRPPALIFRYFAL
jgi:hypothetical protein